MVRDPGAGPVLPGAEVAVASYDEPAARRAAFSGVDTLLLVSAAEHPDRVRQHTDAADAAAAAGVRRVVHTSFLGAAPDATFTLARHHWATETRLRESGVAFTFLPDSLYLDFVPSMAGDRGIIAGPAGEGRVAPVARSDVSDVAVEVLLAGGDHDGETYDLTGPGLQTLGELAEELSQVIGRDVPYVDETLDQAWESRRGYGAPDWEIEGRILSYVAIARGKLAVASDTVRRVTGHDPLDLRGLVARDPCWWPGCAVSSGANHRSRHRCEAVPSAGCRLTARHGGVA